MPNLPAHGSPAYKPPPLPSEGIYHYDLTQQRPGSSFTDVPPPPSLLSPAFTPPSTPGLSTPTTSTTTPPHPEYRPARSVPVDTTSISFAHSQRRYLLERLPTVHCVVRARIPTTTGAEMFLHLYQNDVDNKEHLAIVFGNKIRSSSLDAPVPGETELDRMIRGAYVGRLHPGRVSSKADDTTEEGTHGEKQGQRGADDVAAGGESKDGMEERPQLPLVRIHSECYTGETAWSARCDCGEQLDEAARLMSQPSQSTSPSSAGGVIVYLRQEGRGIGLGEKLKAYNLQDLGKDTVEANLMLRHPADARSYGLATAILMDLGLGGEEGIRLLTNNPDKVVAVEGPNREVRVRERVAMIPLSWKTGGKQGVRGEEIEGYLRTKVGSSTRERRCYGT
ncbi:MAG: hypothetical protein LQ340_000569 [Diploschistes diacapsis]|nr:MAG: hypothetical protein LQ340_000569 [Diploschistes diacapsis]